MAIFYMIEDEAGVAFRELPDQVEEGDEGRLVAAKLPKGAIAVPRLPEPGEAWDPAAKAFILDGEVLARLNAAPADVAAAHALKHAEAVMVASGVPVAAGLLYEEAKATGTKIADLAAAVLANARPLMDREIARRIAIEQARAKKGNGQ
jgi:predicted GTPase